MRTAFIIAAGIALGLVLVKVAEQLVVDPLLGKLMAPAGEPKGAAADLPLEQRKEVQTEND